MIYVYICVCIFKAHLPTEFTQNDLQQMASPQVPSRQILDLPPLQLHQPPGGAGWFDIAGRGVNLAATT